MVTSDLSISNSCSRNLYNNDLVSVCIFSYIPENKVIYKYIYILLIFLISSLNEVVYLTIFMF